MKTSTSTKIRYYDENIHVTLWVCCYSYMYYIVKPHYYRLKDDTILCFSWTQIHVTFQTQLMLHVVSCPFCKALYIMYFIKNNNTMPESGITTWFNTRTFLLLFINWPTEQLPSCALISMSHVMHPPTYIWLHNYIPQSHKWNTSYYSFFLTQTFSSINQKSQFTC